MSTDQAPPSHREAYPRLNLIEARAALDQRRTLCRWHNRNGLRVGHARLRIDSEDTNLLFNMIPLYGSGAVEGTITLQFSDVALGQGRSRMMILCPGCDQTYADLFLKGPKWACADCHRLGYRSKSLGSSTREYERLQSLNMATARGRKKGQHQSTYDRLVRESDTLQRSIGNSPLEMNADIIREISASWIDPGLDDEWLGLPYFSTDGTDPDI